MISKLFLLSYLFMTFLTVPCLFSMGNISQGEIASIGSEPSILNGMSDSDDDDMPEISKLD